MYGQTPPQLSGSPSKWVLPVVLGLGTVAVLAYVSGFASEKGRKRAATNRRRRR